MADALIIEEKDLIADFVAHAPADCFDFLKAIGFNTFALLTIAEDHFCATLSQFPNSWGAEQIWIWIHQWRQRNHLDTIVVPQETNIEGILSPVEAPTTEIEVSEQVKDNEELQPNKVKLDISLEDASTLSVEAGCSEQGSGLSEVVAEKVEQASSNNPKVTLCYRQTDIHVNLDNLCVHLYSIDLS
ncbi:uncharacterized protein LOC134218003 isoform X1 [Armigeres subalbatus]|uniref:uncharacterized protein LOC134218003 isoform X1 n=1 Tax=Armigeres subalbatus TaxID=124917 RepID=UPI002ED26137